MKNRKELLKMMNDLAEEMIALRKGRLPAPREKQKKLAKLTPAENKAWTDAFTYAITELHYGQERADGYAWRDLCKQFPRLSAFDGCRT